MARTLYLAIAGALLVVLVASAVIVFTIARGALRGQLDHALESRAHTFAALITWERGGIEFDYDGPLTEDQLGVVVRIVTEDGDLIARSPDWPEGIAWRDDLAREGYQFATHHEEGVPERRVVSVVALPVPDAEVEPMIDTLGPPPRMVVQVMARTVGVRRTEAALLTALGVGTAGALAGAALGVLLGIRLGLAPLRRLGADLDAAQADAIDPALGSGDYPDELAPVARALSGLLGRVADAMERERRFTDAAAHELRTPIAELKALAEVAERWPEPDRLRRSMAEVRGCAEEVETLLECLLASARGGAAYAHESVRTIEVLPVVETIAAALHARCEERGVRLSVDGDPTAAWQGPPGAVRAIARNLIDNATEYTPGGGTVTVTVTRTDAGASLVVANQPVSLTPDDVARMSEPLWRGSAHRADRDRHQGLGLSIVGALSESLGLSVALTLDGDALRAEVRPQAPEH